jgi:hypothetical protein
MTTSRQLRRVKLVLMLTQVAAIALLTDLATGQVTMPRMRQMAPMQDHHSHTGARDDCEASQR